MKNQNYQAMSKYRKISVRARDQACVTDVAGSTSNQTVAVNAADAAPISAVASTRVPSMVIPVTMIVISSMPEG